MEYTYSRRIRCANLKLTTGEDGNFYLIDRDDNTKIFDIKHDWKSIGTTNGRLQSSTRNKIIDELKSAAQYDDSAKQFVEWYGGNSTPTSSNDDDSDVLSEMREIKELLREQSHSKFEEAMLEGIISKGKELATEDLKEELKQTLNEFIRSEYGALPKVVQIKSEFATTEVKGIFHREYPTILSIVAAKIPLMLVGPAGSGKNHTLEQIAEALNLNFYFSNAITQEYKLTGFVDANGTYQQTEFYKAFKDGGLFFFDEIDASSPDSLIVVNAALANGYFDFPNGKINAHPDFRVVAAANTFGHGADAKYIGRNQLDAATLDRFAVLEFDYDEEVERQLSYDEELYNFIIDLRRAVNRRQLRYVISMRATINASKMMQMGVDKLTILKTVVTKAMSKDDINSIYNELRISNGWTEQLRKVA